ncbi:MAG: aminopeptidase P N-terminal domain-containing protein, partial [Vicinamibacteria bacterium]
MSSSMFAARRRRFTERMGRAVTILPSARVPVKSYDVEHEYHQDTDLFYLTGFEEPESAAVLAPGHPDHPFMLFVRPKEKGKEIWTGRRAGPEGAVVSHGADAAFPIEELASRLPALLENVPRLYYRVGVNREFDERVFAALADLRSRVRKGVAAPSEIVDPSVILHEQR